jgi:hypothetical protein
MKGLQDMILIDEIVETWCSIQSILVAAGNVSKILWPNKKYKIRGDRLRQLLKVEMDSPLYSRAFRNHFEHYDERVEEWFENSPRGLYIDLAMNPSFRSEISNAPPLNTHRGYNSFNNSLVFRNETLYLNEVLTALDNIHNNCQSY